MLTGVMDTAKNCTYLPVMEKIKNAPIIASGLRRRNSCFSSELFHRNAFPVSSLVNGTQDIRCNFFWWVTKSATMKFS